MNFSSLGVVLHELHNRFPDFAFGAWAPHVVQVAEVVYEAHFALFLWEHFEQLHKVLLVDQKVFCAYVKLHRHTLHVLLNPIQIVFWRFLRTVVHHVSWLTVVEPCEAL